MRAYDVIKLKRDGGVLSEAQIRWFMDAYTRGEVAPEQMSALAMAIFFNGLSAPELGAWTDAMLRSGVVLDLGEVPGIKVDKHSTGGVGDKISLPLAPAVAAWGVPVPMVSGRGLGHTGGTLDKLQSIPGFKVDVTVEHYRRQVHDVGCCLMGQTRELAPADKKLYALRDVTATVDCIPLIASSIMSKKMAEGIDALVLDVKFGSGAFMKERKDALVLASTMRSIGEQLGKKVTAYLTNMEEPLGYTVGNALEVVESLEVLRGGGPPDVVALTVALGAEMLWLGGKARDLAEGALRMRQVLSNGAALEKFRQITRAQHGDVRALDDPSLLPTAPHRHTLTSWADGFIGAMDAEAVGLAAMDLGAGRARAEDNVDPAVGLVLRRKVGEAVKAGDALVEIHHRDGRGLESCLARLRKALVITEVAPVRQPLLAERLGDAAPGAWASHP
ncbi:MAG: thymidine phosphorylase [Myxococcota bacterium]